MKNKNILSFEDSDVVSIMLINVCKFGLVLYVQVNNYVMSGWMVSSPNHKNVKMPTVTGILTIMSRLNSKLS